MSSTFMNARWRLALATIAIGVIALAGREMTSADSSTTDFETYALGTVHNQDGWSSSGAAGSGCGVYDHLVDDPSLITGFGTKALRISNAVTSGCFGDQTFSGSLGDEAGETSAEGGGMSGGTRQTFFSAEWDFASAVPDAEQSGLSVVASPDRGDGARMSWVQMADTPTGLELNFNDYQTGTGFVQTNIATGLDRSAVHHLKVTMTFVDGIGDDVVEVYLDGVLVHTGTSWEDYFREQELNPTRTVDSILFRTGGTAAPATSGNGFFIDNLSLFSGPGPACTFTIVGMTMLLDGDCYTEQTIEVPDGFTLDGQSYTITAVDPAGGHFVGAVVANAGSVAHVTDLGVTTDSLADACDEGDDRLRGIMLDGASGSITNNTLTNIRQATASGCQEGNAIEVRNAPFDDTGSDLEVLVSGNTITGYQKTGIVANGSVAATITGNTVVGDGPVTYIAQNGIQVGFSGTAFVRDNSISGNDYTPESDLACGLLLFEADGVNASKNAYETNEKNVCNFARGGGQFNPES
ncbi:MAG: right-handed parallel beta-helix repeat-containing protein [Dehalococcoidia bacterium]